MQLTTETRVGIFVIAALGVFVYMGFKIGAFRFDRANYNTYSVYFDDISGVSAKAAVKIAGVKVGWVNSINLVPADSEMQAEAEVKIRKKYTIYSDSYAVVRQEGLLGPKYIEIIPGDPLLSALEGGSSLGKPSVEPVSLDELLLKFKNIAANVEKVTESFRESIGGFEGQEQLKELFENLGEGAAKMASVSATLDRLIENNEDNLDDFFKVGGDIRRLAQRMEDQVLPTFQEGIEKISDVFDRDFDRVATQLEATAGSLEEASIQARDGFKNLSSVAGKIDEGKGLLGKLINEDETYRDLKIAVEGVRNYFAKVDSLQIVFDTHVESMHRPAENYRFEDSKGYFDVRVYPTEDKFYLIQLAASEKGWVDRWEVSKQYKDFDDNTIDSRKLSYDTYLTEDINTTDGARATAVQTTIEDLYTEKLEKYTRNTIKLGVQFGKIFGNIAFRAGLFEGSAGVGVDFDIPLGTDKIRWVTTFEAFDLRGWNRKHDRRPHLKWLNRMFFVRNIYFTFGADDWVSKRNANAFFGAGIRFGDDQIKYLASNFSGIVSGLQSSC